MKRHLVLLSLVIILTFTSVAGIISGNNKTLTLTEDSDNLPEDLLQLIQTTDYGKLQREMATDLVSKFDKQLKSPGYSLINFEKDVCELIDTLVEQHQFIAAGLIIRYASQHLLPLYQSDIENSNLDHFTTSVTDYYLSAQAYHKATKWLLNAIEFTLKTNRDSGNCWIRNKFNSVVLYKQFNNSEQAVNMFNEGMRDVLAMKKEEVSPYTINAMLRAAHSLIDLEIPDSFQQLLEYSDSHKNLTPVNLAYYILFRAKLLSRIKGDYNNAHELYKILIDSPVANIGYQTAIGDILEAAWHANKDDYAILLLTTSHMGRDLIQLTLNSMSLNDSEYYWQSAASQLNKGFGIRLNDPDCNYSDMMGIFLNAVFTKSLSVLNRKDVADLIKEQGDDVAKSLLHDIEDLRHKMANTTDEELREQYDDDLDKAEMGLRASMDLSWVGGEQHNKAMFMPRALKKGECEVEIVEYPCISDTVNTNHYGAIICTSAPHKDKATGIDFQLEHYEFVPLGPVLAWEMLYNGFGNKTDRDRADQYSKETLLTVANLFSPLFTYFQENNLKRAYVSPTGLLNVINIGALPWPESNSIVNDNVEIIRINAAYDVEEIMKRDTRLKSALVFSNIDFNKAADLANVKERSGSGVPPEIAGYRIKVEKGGNMKKFPRLPINEDKLKESIKEGTRSLKLYSGENATEEIFKKINGNAPELLHIDTHGFYIPEGDNAFIGKHVIQGTRESALLTCGLALAGANKAWGGEEIKPGSEDGVLTAWEISCMDLSGCKLAVLSACETAQGVLDNINGVMGLQRALRLAGVQAMLLTLWPVDNELTEEFINDFYRRLPDSAHFNDAFLATQREFRKRHTDPYHWAPFILIN